MNDHPELPPLDPTPIAEGDQSWSPFAQHIGPPEQNLFEVNRTADGDPAPTSASRIQSTPRGAARVRRPSVRFTQQWTSRALAIGAAVAVVTACAGLAMSDLGGSDEHRSPVARIGREADPVDSRRAATTHSSAAPTTLATPNPPAGRRRPAQAGSTHARATRRRRPTATGRRRVPARTRQVSVQSSSVPSSPVVTQPTVAPSSQAPPVPLPVSRSVPAPAASPARASEFGFER